MYIIRLQAQLFNKGSSLFISLTHSWVRSVHWDPLIASYSAKIEQVQRRFLSYSSYILNIPHPIHDYSVVVDELGLLTLANRRINSNIRFLQNCIGGSADVPLFLFGFFL